MSTTAKGMDSFLDILELIKNPAKFDAKVQELNQATKQYTASVEAVVSLAAVNDYTQSIRKREEESKQILSDARTEAASELAKARAKASEVLAKAEETSEKAKKALAAVVARENDLEPQEKALLARREALAVAEKAVVDREEAASVLEMDLAARKAKLLAAMG